MGLRLVASWLFFIFYYLVNAEIWKFVDGRYNEIMAFWFAAITLLLPTVGAIVFIDVVSRHLFKKDNK